MVAHANTIDGLAVQQADAAAAKVAADLKTAEQEVKTSRAALMTAEVRLVDASNAMAAAKQLQTMARGDYR